MFPTVLIHKTWALSGFVEPVASDESAGMSSAPAAMVQLQLLTSMSQCPGKKCLPLFRLQCFCFFLVCRCCRWRARSVTLSTCVCVCDSSLQYCRSNAGLRSIFEVWYSAAGSSFLMSAAPCGWHQIFPNVFVERPTGPLLRLCLALQNTLRLESPVADAAWIRQNVDFFFFFLFNLNWILFYRLCRADKLTFNHIFFLW